MPPGPPHETCWTLIRGAAAGNGENRSAFSHQYLPLVRAYLAARWQQTPLTEQLDDAIQEVFLECFRPQGVLAKADPTRASGFRSLLLGVVTNVARRVERRVARAQARRDPGSFHPEALQAREEALSKLFDRAWAQSIMRQAVELQRRRAVTDSAQRRVEILRLRFEEGLPIREIAARWDAKPQALHKAYGRAREEYRACLREVVGDHDPAAKDLERECMRLASLLE